ncbi:hypothetical protein OPV22_008630 [Ensete ventricosum]|uniref:Uncharacterized protein n=1 Tax=Ensete ventricosum TaxID=4639 RepID=A0AAV8RDZ8_ENSVE|nr:hypothetical protein OPV22_008630 [Ensete ventricosum]
MNPLNPKPNNERLPSSEESRSKCRPRAHPLEFSFLLVCDWEVTALAGGQRPPGVKPHSPGTFYAVKI